ncbi:MAG: MraY family glycosyltransferase [Candidatus Paceibacterota bacterium]
MIILMLIISGLIAAISAPFIIRWYTKHDWLDDPQKIPHLKKTHQSPVPRGGGLVVFLGILLTSLFFLQIDGYLLAILLGAGLLTLIGVIDDVKDIHPAIRLGTGLLASLIVVGSGIGIAYISNPFGPGVIHLNFPIWEIVAFGQTHVVWVLSSLFAIFFINWNMNILNWSKGVDGQLPGFVSIAAIFIGLLSLRFQDDPTTFNTAHLSFIVAGAYLGLLIWNWYPQKMMPGYGAGSLAGYFLSVLAILSGAKVAATLMVLALPTADGIFTIARRILAGKSPLWGDRGHLHHKLMDILGWGRRRIAIFYWLVSLLLGIISLFLGTTGKIIVFGSVVLFVFGFLIWAKTYSLKNK